MSKKIIVELLNDVRIWETSWILYNKDTNRAKPICSEKFGQYLNIKYKVKRRNE